MSTRNRPNNWLLISFDQWRGDWLHQSWLQLPHLLRLAKEGWDVRRCYTSSPQCIPARASWLTGLTPGELGVTINKVYTVPANAPSFVRELRDCFNYNTSLVGKTHWTPHLEGVDLRDKLPLMHALGFNHVREIAGPRAMAVVDCELTDLWRDAGVLQDYRNDLIDRYRDGCMHTVRPTVLPEDLYPDLWLTDVALEELAGMSEDDPWFLWVSFPGPHEPFDVPLSWRGHHGSIPSPEGRPTDPELLADLAPSGSVLDKKLAAWPDGVPEPALTDLRSDYADHLHLLDAQLGRLLSALKDRPDGKRTAITVCSDHGELLGDWGLLLKGCFLEASIRSLFLHNPPGGRGGLRRLWQPLHRPHGLTKCLWDAFVAVSRPDEGSFGRRLRQQPTEVLVEFAQERLCLR
jgi:choline-sulfatase